MIGRWHVWTNGRYIGEVSATEDTIRAWFPNARFNHTLRIVTLN